MGRTRVADESRVVESESNHAGFERSRAGRRGRPQDGAHWHYVRDILMAQIRAAQAKAH